MKVVFEDDLLAEIYLGKYAGKPLFPAGIVERFVNFVNQARKAESLQNLRSIPGFRIEKLLNDYYSLRLNQQYRVIFTHQSEEVTITLIEISKHYQ